MSSSESDTGRPEATSIAYFNFVCCPTKCCVWGTVTPSIKASLDGIVESVNSIKGSLDSIKESVNGVSSTISTELGTISTQLGRIENAIADGVASLRRDSYTNDTPTSRAGSISSDPSNRPTQHDDENEAESDSTVRQNESITNSVRARDELADVQVMRPSQRSEEKKEDE